MRHCLAKTPPRVPESGQNDIPTAQYHQSPEMRTLILPVQTRGSTSSPAPSSPTTSASITISLEDVDLESVPIIIEQTSPVLSRITRRKRKDTVTDLETPPPKKIALSYMEPESMILSIEKPKARGRRRKK